MSYERSKEVFKNEYDIRVFLIDSPTKVPEMGHYQIIKFDKSSVFVPGDERSRTNPGHGYPEHTETYETNKIYCFTNKSDWLEALTMFYNREPHRHDILAQEVTKVGKVRYDITVD